MNIDINVIGLGYIGLPTALIFAKNGFRVVGTDYNNDIVESLNNNKLTFDEKGMEELFDIALKNSIKFSSDYQKCGMYIVAVPTPYDKFSKKIDDKYIKIAVESILNICESGSIIVIESTVSPGTINKSIKPLVESKGFVVGKDIYLVHAPERIIPGNMVYELEHNSRTIGSDDKIIGEKVASMYEKITQGGGNYYRH